VVCVIISDVNHSNQLSTDVLLTAGDRDLIYCLVACRVLKWSGR